VTVEGPYVFNINLLDMSFKRDFYFIVRAGLVIDPVNRLVERCCAGRH